MEGKQVYVKEKLAIKPQVQILACCRLWIHFIDLLFNQPLTCIQYRQYPVNEKLPLDLGNT